MMRFSLSALRLASAFFAFAQAMAQTLPAQARPVGSTRAALLVAERARINECLREHEPIRNWVELYVKLEPDGMISRQFRVASPMDSDQSREDVKKILRKIHQCEPFMVGLFESTNDH